MFYLANLIYFQQSKASKSVPNKSNYQKGDSLIKVSHSVSVFSLFPAECRSVVQSWCLLQMPKHEHLLKPETRSSRSVRAVKQDLLSKNQKQDLKTSKEPMCLTAQIWGNRAVMRASDSHVSYDNNPLPWEEEPWCLRFLR